MSSENGGFELVLKANGTCLMLSMPLILLSTGFLL